MLNRSFTVPGKHLAGIAACSFLIWTPIGNDALAGVTTDGSAGAVAALSGTMTIPQSLGRLSGNNLFHSFSTFNINTGESATFTTTTPTIANVISRVTGGTTSSINGALRLTPVAGNPAFYFINPAGITFGAGASIDMPGAFHVGTADYLKFADGNYYAELTKASAFSSAAPESFGFINATPAKLLVDGVVLNNAMRDIEIAAGNVELINSASINTSAPGPMPGGSITITALGDLSVNHSNILANAIATGDAGNITLKVQGTLGLNGGAISSDSISLVGGKSGNINVTSRHLTMIGQPTAATQIVSNTFGIGEAGSVNISLTGNLSIVGGGVITSSSRMGLGNAGSVYIRADNISLNKDSSSSQNVVISTQTGDPRAPLRMGNGNAGNIDISTPGYFLITNGAQIISGTSTLNGAAGSISINAGKLIIDGYYGDSSIPSNINARAYKISGNSSSGQTGIITIHANEMILSNSGQITIQNDATVANPSLLTPTSISITADRITLNDASISAASTGNVAASNIVVNFTDLLHLDPSSITTSAQNGNGGAITINGGRLIWLDNSQITTSVLGATGNGGDISINADGMLMATGFIQANTAAAGAAGGLVDIHVPTLLASGSNVFVGGSTQQVFAPDQFGLNVIQAAAPDGVSGEINLSAPVLDVSGSMATLGVPAMGAVPLGRNPCATLAGSSLNTTGIDILPPAARDSLSLDLPVDTPVQSGGSIPQGPPRGVASSGTECRP